MERFTPDNIEEFLEQKCRREEIPVKERLRLLLDLIRGRHYSFGRVVHMSLNHDNPSETIIYINAGRRLKSKDGTTGIHLEGVRVETIQVLEQAIHRDDYIESNYLLGRVKKITSLELLEQYFTDIPDKDFTWDSVVSCTVWERL